MSIAPIRIAIAAGGTGGHIYPALAAAQAIMRKHPDAALLYFCGSREIETEIYRKQGIAPVILPIGRYSAGITAKIRLTAQLVNAFGRAKIALQEFRPNCLLGMGGYIGYPPVRAAHKLGVPIVLHEPNRALGKAHRWSAQWAARIACSYAETAREIGPRQAVLTGLPVRGEFGQAGRDAAREFFGVPPDALCLLLSGGSQGAARLNRTVLECLPELAAWARRRQTRLILLWSCGAQFYGERNAAELSFDREFFRSAAFPFIERMDLACAAADLIISRAGAGSVAECAASGRPAIFIPLASAAEDHQRRNAEAVEQAGGARMLLESEANAARLCAEIFALFERPEKLAQLAQAAHALAQPDAADKLAAVILQTAVSSEQQT